LLRRSLQTLLLLLMLLAAAATTATTVATTAVTTTAYRWCCNLATPVAVAAAVRCRCYKYNRYCCCCYNRCCWYRLTLLSLLLLTLVQLLLPFAAVAIVTTVANAFNHHCYGKRDTVALDTGTERRSVAWWLGMTLGMETRYGGSAR
jgi:hypothetical protein